MRVAIQDPKTGTPLRVNDDGTLAISGLATAPAESQSPPVDAATETTLAAILAELATKYSGQNITVTVDNLPATQPISGSISVTNFPASTALTDAQLRANPLPVSGTFYPATQPISGNVSVSNFPATQPISGTVSVSNQPSSLSVSNFPATQPVSGSVTLTNPYIPSTNAVTATGAAAAAVTLTLPASSAQFHYITRLEINLYSTAARTGAATPIVVTTTNLPGNPAYTLPTAGAIGTTETRVAEYPFPLKSSTVNTATTVVCPAVTGGLWRVNCVYFLGA